MKSQNLFFFLPIAALLAGCATISETDCLALDWQQVGFEDGNKGIAASEDNSYLQNCSKYEIEMDENAYDLGHQRGVALFCQPDNGFELGTQNYRASVVCPPDFNVQYNIGYQFYVANANISEAEMALINSDANINRLQSGIATAYSQLNRPNLTPLEEHQLRQDIASMESQIAAQERSRDRLEPVINELRQDLENLKRQHGK